MREKIIWLTIPVTIALLFSCGCSPATSVMGESGIRRLTEHEIASQELTANIARRHFCCGQYQQCITELHRFCGEKTTSLPLYQCEIGAGYLARNDKANAEKYLLDAYTSIEGFFDPASEKEAVSLWGAEAEKVYKGDPYEQATLSLFVGLLMLEKGEVDNALACFKNGQLADSSSGEFNYQSDYGLLQMLEAKCYQMRGEQVAYEQMCEKAVDSFAMCHPSYCARRANITEQMRKAEQAGADAAVTESDIAAMREKVLYGYQSYYEPMLQPYNTLLLIWSGRAPRLQRAGTYGEQRVFLKRDTCDYHYEVQVNDSMWFDPIRGFADIGFQATTRGGREMDNVLASHASFKHGAHSVSQTLADAAGDAGDASVALVMLGAALIAEGLGSAANAQADIRCWQTLPDEICVVPLNLPPGSHRVRVDCYDDIFKVKRRLQYNLNVRAKPFQFYNLVLPTSQPPKEENNS